MTSNASTNSSLPTAVIGDGWAALTLATLLSTSGKDVLWIAGTGARAAAPLPTLESGPAVDALQLCLTRLGLEEEAPQAGAFLREFRNKSFSRPSWIKAPTREDRAQVLQEMLWAPETRFVPLFEARFPLTLIEIEEKIRARLAEQPSIRKVSGIPVSGFGFDEGTHVLLGSGESFAVEHVYFADRWSSLLGMEGLPKGNSLTRNREPMGILQAIFTHHSAMTSADLREGFFGLTHKDPGEEITRNVFGYFFDEGRKSVWSIFVAPEESEDNHAIAKKLRRLKQALDRMFTGSDWLPEGKAEFMATVKDEQVRFEEAFVLSQGEVPAEPMSIAKVPGVTFVTDGFGPSEAFRLAAQALGVNLIPATTTETEATPSA